MCPLDENQGGPFFTQHKDTLDAQRMPNLDQQAKQCEERLNNTILQKFHNKLEEQDTQES